MKKYSRIAGISLLVGIYTAFCFEIGGRIGAEEGRRLTAEAIAVRFAVKSVLYGTFIFVTYIWGVKLPQLWGRYRASVGQRRAKSFLERAEKFRLPFWGCMLLLLLMWMPVYLTIFPGAFAYDAPTQWQQFRDGAITAHHPVLHTLLVGACLEWGEKLSSYNLGIAIYTVGQMTAIAAVFSYTLGFMRRYGIPVLLRGAAVLYWGLSPVVQLFVVSSTKDVLFTGVFLLFLLSLIDYGFRREEFLGSRRGRARFLLTAAGVMVLRNNGPYIVAGTLLLMFILGPMRKKLLPLLAGLAVFYLVYTGPFYRLLDVEKAPVGEMLCVPLQQMARTYLFHYGELEREDIAMLEELVPREDLLQYVSTLADVVKRNLREDVLREDPVGYLRLWAKWGMRYPFVYVQSFLINTVDYWYPFAVVDGYDPGTERTDFFRYSVGPPGERVEMLPKLHEWYRALSEDRSASEIPFLFLLISPGWYLLLTIYFACGFWGLRRKEYLLPCAALTISELTVLMGPVVQVRYVLILYFAFPLLAVLYLREQRRSLEDKAAGVDGKASCEAGEKA